MNSAASSPPESYQGLSPFLRASIAGIDLRPLAQAMIAGLENDDGNAEHWMMLAYLMRSLGQEALGATMQSEALAMQPTYRIAARRPPARLRLLVLMLPGPLSANTPIECLLEDSPLELIHYFLDPRQLFTSRPPEHDLVLVAIGHADSHSPILAALAERLADWPRPVINSPARIASTERVQASRLLRNIPGVQVPPTRLVSRPTLLAGLGTHGAPADCNFPLIIRPTHSHGGHGLERIETPAALADYLAACGDDSFYLAPFVDYRSADGFYRKYRIALLDGQAYPCHLAISSHWMIHYLNAGMYEDAAKRREEARFMAQFADFEGRHGAALRAIQQRSGLDYLCLDCAETADGDLLIFEIDHAMIVHAMDSEDLFPFKQMHIARLRDAFCDYLQRRAGLAEHAVA